MPNGGLQNTILRAVLGKNGCHFQKIFPKIVDFSSKLGEGNQSVWFFICAIKITDPIWNFLQIL